MALATVALAVGLSIPALAFASEGAIATVEDPNGEITEFADLQDAFDYAASFGKPDAEWSDMTSVYLQNDVDLGDGFISIEAEGAVDVYFYMNGHELTSTSPECTIEIGQDVHLQICNGLVANHGSAGKAVVINHCSFLLGEPDFGDDGIPPASLVAGEGVDCAILNQPGAWADIDNGIVKGGDYAIINYGDFWVSDAIITGDVVVADLVADEVAAYLSFWNGTLNGGFVVDEGYDGAEASVTGGRFSTDPAEYVDLEGGWGWYAIFGPVDGYWVVSSVEDNYALECPHDEDCQLALYEDTDPDAWYHDGLEWALNMGVINGYLPDGEFIATEIGPTDTITREQFATMMFRYAGMRNFDMTVGDFATLEFVDAAKVSGWAEEAIKWAVATGILRGYDDGSGLGPQDELTREQLATMLHRFAEYSVMDTSVGEDTNVLGYKDADKIGGWAMEAMQWAVGSGVVGGYTDDSGEPTGYLGPKDECQRAHAATMLMRFYYL